MLWGMAEELELGLNIVKLLSMLEVEKVFDRVSGASEELERLIKRSEK